MDRVGSIDKRYSKISLARGRLGRLSLAERALLTCSRHPADVPGFEGYAAYIDRPIGDPLRHLREYFPHLLQLIAGKRVLDFGCGDGQQAIALARNGAAEVVGIDIAERRLERARHLAVSTPNVRFDTIMDGSFDTVVCQDAFEHFADPEGTLASMCARLKPGGKILLTFGPLWYAPYGAHCYFFTRLPWVHLIFAEKTVFRVRALYRRYAGNGYRDGMNMMTVRRFHRIAAALPDCLVDNLALRCIKRLDFLARVPLLRELCVNEISCIIRKRG
jgi:SAM-dependent methyltransferase